MVIEAWAFWFFVFPCQRIALDRCALVWCQSFLNPRAAYLIIDLNFWDGFFYETRTSIQSAKQMLVSVQKKAGRSIYVQARGDHGLIRQ